MRETHIHAIGHRGPIRLRAVIVGKLAATKSDLPKSRWSVTHIKSGLMLPALFPSRRDAVAAAKRIGHLLDWDAHVARLDTLSEDEKSAVWWGDVWPIVAQFRAVSTKWRPSHD